MSLPVDTIATQSLNALTTGMQIVLIASGLTIILGLQGVFNFAHGAFFMLAGYLAYAAFFTVLAPVTFIEFLVGIVVVFLGLALVGMAVERVLIRPLMDREEAPLQQFILTFGLTFVIIETVEFVFGSQFRTASAPGSITGLVNLGPITYPTYWLFVIVFSGVVMGGLFALFAYTRIGTIIRAITYDREMAAALGHDIDRISLYVFGLGSGFAGIAGVLGPPVIGAGIYPELGTEIIVPVVIAIFLGGLGSIRGTVVGGLIVGATLTVVTVFAGSFMAEMVVAGILVVVLLVRPEGLYGYAGILE